MKILLISHILPYPPKGGCPQRNFNLLKECSETNEIHMLAFYRKSHQTSPAEFQTAIEAMKQYCSKVEVFPIPAEQNRLLWYLLLFLNIFSSLPYSVWLYSSRQMKRAVEKYSLNETYDVMEIGEIGLAKYARMVPGVARILIHHNVESQLLFRRGKFAGNWFSKVYLMLQAYKLRRFERLAGQYFTYQTAVSDEDKVVLEKICPNANIAVIPNGVDTEYFVTNMHDMEDDSIIYVGGTTWFPNYDAVQYFIRDIFPLVKKEIPDITLHHIGRQIDDKLHKIAAGGDNIKIHGFVDDIRPLVAKAAIFIVPLRIGGGTRLKIVDALSMGKAIVSTSIGCEGIKVTDKVDIVVADTPRDFADNIIGLIRDRDRREKLMANARKTALEKYSWKTIAPLLNDVYKKAKELKG